MATFKMTVVHQSQLPAGLNPTTSPRRGREMAGILERLAQAAATGTTRTNGFDLFVSSEDPKFAYGLGAYATVSGTVGFTINGVSVTVTAAGGDVASATSTVTAINSSVNALVQYLAKATNITSAFTVGTLVAPVTVWVMGSPVYGVQRAIQAGERGVFQITGTAATDAANLAAAINGSPTLFGRCIAAVLSGAVVTVWAMSNTVPSGTAINGADTTLITATAYAASANICVFAAQPGRLGNCQQFAATGTGVTVSTGARLVNGTGVTGTTYSDSI